jgi:hypothetical protein
MGMRYGARRSVMIGVATAGSLMLATAAQARYTAIDQSGPTSYYATFGGYCETFPGTTGRGSIGDSCSTSYTLPYAATFAGGTTNKVIIRSDGIMEFVTGVLDPTSVDPTRPFGDALATVDTGIHNVPGSLGQLAVLGLARYTGGPVTRPSPSSGIPFIPEDPIDYMVHAPVFTVTWFTCNKPVLACFGDQHTATLTPGVDGFSVVYSGGRSELIRASISPLPPSGTPEPAVWAMLVMGFGGLGSVLRRRRAAQAAAG